jgi:hypothetical protein
MATHNRVERQIVRTDGSHIHTDTGTTANGAPVGDLLKQLAGQSGDLVRNEMALAKLEMRDMARQLARDSAKVGAAIALAAVGGLALVAAAIIALGNLLNGMYALSALIIGVLFLVVGAVMARSGMEGLKSPPKPDETVRTMQENKEWASREAREFKEEIRS